MVFECEIHPSPDLSSDQCRALGLAIYRWLYTDQANRSVDWFGMDDLREHGELPQPWYLRKLMAIEGRTLPEEEIGKPGTPKVRTLTEEERESLRASLGEKALSRHIPLTVYYARPSDRARIIEGLRSLIPSELVLDVTVNGVSWQE
jgi:hypothetical protein